MILLCVLIDETLFIVSDKLHQHFESSLPLVFLCLGAFFLNIQLVIMSAGQRILILEALLVKVLFRCTIARIWGLAERSCFRKTLLWVLSLSLSVRERCVFNIKERKSNKHFYWYDNFSVSGSSRTTLISSSKRPDRIGTTVVANVGFCEGRKLEFLRGKTLNRGPRSIKKLLKIVDCKYVNRPQPIRSYFGKRWSSANALNWLIQATDFPGEFHIIWITHTHAYVPSVLVQIKTTYYK